MDYLSKYIYDVTARFSSIFTKLFHSLENI